MPHPLLSVAIAVLVLRVIGAQDQRLESSLSKMYKTAGESHEKYQTQQVPVVPPIQSPAYQSGSYQAPSAYQGNSYQSPPGYQSPTYQAPVAYQSSNYQTPLTYQAAASTTTVCIEVRNTPHSQSPTTTVCGPQVSPHSTFPQGYKEADDSYKEAYDSYKEAYDSYKEADDSYKEADPGPTRVYPMMPVHTAVMPQTYAVHTIHPPPVHYHDVHPAMYGSPYYGHHFRSSDQPQGPPRSSYDSVPNLAPPPIYTSSDASYPPPSNQASYPPPSYQAPYPAPSYEASHYVPPSHQPLVVNCQVQPAPDHHYSVGRAADVREMEPTNDMYVMPSSRYATPEDAYMPRMPTNDPMMPPGASPCLYESQPRAAFIDPMYSRAADQPMLPPHMMPQSVMFQPVQMGNQLMGGQPHQPMSKAQRQQELAASERRIAELKGRLGQNPQQLPPQQPKPYQINSQQQQPYQPTPQQQPLLQPPPQQQPSQQQQQPGGAKDADSPRADGLSSPSSPSGQGGPIQQAPGPAPKPITPPVNQSPKQV